MNVIFKLLTVKKHPTGVAFIALLFGLSFLTLSFVTEIIHQEILLQKIFAYVFEVMIIIFVLYSIIRKNTKVLEISIVVLKTFEGSYYPLIACAKLDTVIFGNFFDPFYVVNYIIFGVASLFMLVALIFYCTYKSHGKRTSWNFMKLFILLASSAMFVSSIFFVVETVRGTVHWSEIFEPIALCSLFFGVYATCEYIEEKVEHVKKANIA